LRKMYYEILAEVHDRASFLHCRFIRQF